MTSAITKRLERLEGPGGTEDSGPRPEDVFSFVEDASGAPGSINVVDGWEYIDHEGNPVVIMREPGEDDESLEGRACAAGRELMRTYPQARRPMFHPVNERIIDQE